MNASDAGSPMDPGVLEPLRRTALFYPCSGNDLELPILLFSSAISDFYFVDLRRPRLPRGGMAQLRRHSRNEAIPDEFEDVGTGNQFRVHRRQHDAEAFLDEVPDLGVFFFRGDNPVQGEGSSGILWLGGALFSRILGKLVPGGLVVTDGSNPGPNGPESLSAFYHQRNKGPEVKQQATPFTYAGREFSCLAFVGQRYGPTLVWQVN
jgi:hypothetical protein